MFILASNTWQPNRKSLWPHSVCASAVLMLGAAGLFGCGGGAKPPSLIAVCNSQTPVLSVPDQPTQIDWAKAGPMAGLIQMCCDPGTNYKAFLPAITANQEMCIRCSASCLPTGADAGVAAYRSSAVINDAFHSMSQLMGQSKAQAGNKASPTPVSLIYAQNTNSNAATADTSNLPTGGVPTPQTLPGMPSLKGLTQGLGSAGSGTGGGGSGGGGSGSGISFGADGGLRRGNSNSDAKGQMLAEGGLAGSVYAGGGGGGGRGGGAGRNGSFFGSGSGGWGSGSGEGGSGGKAGVVQFGQSGAGSGDAAGTAQMSEDPEDYFTRINLDQSLFKIVHDRYQTKEASFVVGH